MNPQPSYLDKVKRQALMERWASWGRGHRLALRMARCLLHVAGIAVNEGNPITTEKVRALIELCGNLALIPIDEWPTEWAREFGVPRDGLYLGFIQPDGHVTGFLAWNPHVQTKRQIWTFLHEVVHHVLLCLRMANQIPSLAGERVIRRRDYLAAVWQGDTEETFVDLVVAQMVMDPHLFGTSMVEKNLFDLAHLYGVNLEPAAVHLCSLSPVPLACIIGSVSGEAGAKYRLIVRRADSQVMDIVSYLIAQTPLTKRCCMHTLRANGNTYSLACYVYPIGSGHEQTHRLIAFLTLRDHAKHLGVFTAFPAILQATAA